MTNYVPVTFEQVGNNYTVSVEFPPNTTDNAMSLAFPSRLVEGYADTTDVFEGALDGDTYVVWRALTAMSGLVGSVTVNLIDGGVITLYYDFT